MATLTPDQFADKLNQFARGLPKVVSEATFKAAQNLNATITGRIFKVGGSKDTGGNKRKYRSKEWVAERKRVGKIELTYVDHEFTGNLMKSVQLLPTKKNSYELKIIGNNNVKKARDNEDLYPSGSVFAASKKEREVAVEVFEESIADYIQSIF